MPCGMFTNHWDSEFPERDKVHSPMASDFRSGALGEGEGELRPVKGKSPIDGRGDLLSVLLLPLIGRHAGGLPTQGVVSLRSPCPGL